jgi:hypothetical protein
LVALRVIGDGCEDELLSCVFSFDRLIAPSSMYRRAIGCRYGDDCGKRTTHHPDAHTHCVCACAALCAVEVRSQITRPHAAYGEQLRCCKAKRRTCIVEQMRKSRPQLRSRRQLARNRLR